MSTFFQISNTILMMIFGGALLLAALVTMGLPSINVFGREEVPHQIGSPNSTAPEDLEWQLFKARYGKVYDNSEEEASRRAVFAQNKQRIDELNARSDATTRGFTIGLNHLADWTDSERKVLNGFRMPSDPRRRRQAFVNQPEAAEFLDKILNDNQSAPIPEELDWRQTPGRVTRVKDQGQCGSCWAFATTGALEGQEITRPKRQGSANDAEESPAIVGLSEQQLVDCDQIDAGCSGGIMSDAYYWLYMEGGIDSEDSYPYEGVARKCRFNETKVVMKNRSYATLPSGDEQTLKQVVAKFGPVAVAIDAKSLYFQAYKSGVYYGKWCHSWSFLLDHAVLVVGYGTDPKQGDYWLVKNSWGADWGDQGYIKMARNRGNNCGIATVATIPTF